ncbi:hypothetical protein [Capnocytophaga catalasegens]|uniref:Prokaryotic RING finger family 4 n=1 Tax=Capnocytophaga catalasegens TaxID=1004260 RepID=A0AAV5AZN7_9FLAO|nr:hypothetical protein [Capnocytophaga catalasegens]GIZ14395.1 hypothetical protein RCZ03_03960 [Capnocytophaga catalasegens]GJM51515.1 hypothetical protein RCZ15_24880 [Capnocytophaga catalasegens]GJM53419.1 hypothetical protein RCZ16_17360 [Capnocytophaga catalasegens]
MKDLQRIAIRQGKIYIKEAQTTFREPKKTSLLLLNTLSKHGFEVSEALLYALSTLSEAEISEIVTCIEEILGTKLNWTPLVKNWDIPTGETIYDHWITAFYNDEINDFPSLKIWEYYYDNAYDYDLYQGVRLNCGHLIPNGTFPLHRYNGCPFCGTPFVFDKLKLEHKGSKRRLLDLWTDKDIVLYFENILASKIPLDATQSDSLKILLKNIDYQGNITISMKETLVLVVDELIAQGKGEQAGHFFKSPTDIMRYLWYKKTGFLQIIEPKTLINKNAKNHSHISPLHNLSTFAKIASKQDLKLKYTRKEAKMVANWLNSMELTPEKMAEQMHPKRNMWVRFIRALRLAEYSKKSGFENLRELLDIFYNQVYEVWQGRINHFRMKSDAENTFSLLKQRPGLFARSLFANMLWFGADITIEAFKEITPKVPMRLLLALESYAGLYFQHETTRSVRSITGIRKNIPANQYTSLYSKEELSQMTKQIQQLCLKAFKERFEKQEVDFQRIYIDPELYKIPFPIGDRGQNIQDFEPTFMGERIPLEGNTIRLFMQWGEGLPAQHLDMDLSCNIAYHNGEMAVCNYANLTTKGAKHSGDIREIPNKVGTAEYIEINVNELRKMNAEYVTFTCNAYSVGSISPNLVVGWMDSKHKMKISERSGVAYDPSCVIKQVRISQTLQKGLVFGVLDVLNAEIIWLEMPFDGQTVHNLDRDAVSAMLLKLQSKISIGKILKIKAKAQFLEEVSDPTIADTIYNVAWARKIENLNSLLID